MTDAAIDAVLAPTVSLLALGIVAALASRALKLSPIVGYIVLGLILRATGAERWLGASAISVLAQVGVVLLLFDIGLHFSLDRLRRQAGDIFAFGPVQVLASTLLLGIAGAILGVPIGSALLIGAILALSSTAVVGRLISERHQQGCPVGLTATSILVFQDVFAILLLVLASAITAGGSLVTASLVAIGKAVLAFAVTFIASRLVVGRVLGLVARTKNDEIFTAVALLFALAAGWATGSIGLSLTLGAFLGGQALAETPYKNVIEYEIKPFRVCSWASSSSRSACLRATVPARSLANDPGAERSRARSQGDRQRHCEPDLPMVCTRLHSAGLPAQSGLGVRFRHPRASGRSDHGRP